MKTQRTMRTKSFSQQMQELAQEYMEINHLDSFDLDEVARWACSTGRYQRHPMTIVQQCKRELADALRIQKYTDSQGREVRKMHPVRLKEKGAQMVIWADIEKAPPQHMRVSLAQSRQGILADCIAHNTIVESYNDNNRHNAQIEPFDYNFNPDLAEKKLPTEYPDEAPNDEDDQE